jgi:hypothetical protein
MWALTYINDIADHISGIRPNMALTERRKTVPSEDWCNNASDCGFAGRRRSRLQRNSQLPEQTNSSFVGFFLDWRYAPSGRTMDFRTAAVRLAE